MAKSKRKKTGTPPRRNIQKPATKQRPPRLIWRQEKNGNWVPLVIIGDIVMPGSERPFMGFHKDERAAILVWVKQMLSEILFDCPQFLVNEKNMITAENPDWHLLPYFERDPKDPNTYIEVTPEPSLAQVEAGEQLPISGS